MRCLLVLLPVRQLDSYFHQAWIKSCVVARSPRRYLSGRRRRAAIDCHIPQRKTARQHRPHARQHHTTTSAYRSQCQFFCFFTATAPLSALWNLKKAPPRLNALGIVLLRSMMCSQQDGRHLNFLETGSFWDSRCGFVITVRVDAFDLHLDNCWMVRAEVKEEPLDEALRDAAIGRS